jgi:uncharacterized protein (DUF1330 family)
MAIVPTRDQIKEFIDLDVEGEIVMLNLLKYKQRASDESQGTGESAYHRYGDAARKMVEARGGRLLWAGRALHTLIGDADADDWDVVLLVAYPSKSTFIEMTSQPEYQEAHEHREAGLDRTVLVATKPGSGFA